MSAIPTARSRIAPRTLQHWDDASPIVALTAYSAPMARLLDPHCDLLLVGDSLGMVLYGMESTLGVTLDMMIAHGRAVMRGSHRACVIVDMPFASYQASPEQAFANAARVMAETGCSGIKLEGGTEMAETVDFLVRRGIPVLGHIGMKPQSFHTHGGFRAQGREEGERANILADAVAIEEAGAFAVVIESTIEPVVREVIARIAIPTIGIGASPACRGQILVTDDMTGLFSDFTPKFVKKYVQTGTIIAKAVEEYASEVRHRQFPAPEHCFGISRGPAVSGKG